MELPFAVNSAVDRLYSNGCEAAVVGGCVRDSLLGIAPHDWDICTAAKPEEILHIFSDVPCIPTGIRFGTITVLWQGLSLEVTTYRTENGYTDNRRPDAVSYVSDINADLARRDFTVNAMAYSPDKGLIDPFGGKEDLKHGILRAVGDANERFSEDALRILRALRFSAVYGFTIEPFTEQALFDHAYRLSQIAAERIREELDRLLVGKNVAKILRMYHEVLYPVLPELRPMVGFSQENPYHDRDVFEHTLSAVEASPPERTVRLALLLHDCGKPLCFTRDEKGIGHFHGHAAISEQIAATVLKRLRYDNGTVDRVCLLIRYHDTPIEPTVKSVRRFLSRMGEDALRQLLDVKEGDTRAHTPSIIGKRIEEIAMTRECLDTVLREEQCFSLRQLAVDGDDLIALGIPKGKRLGELLNGLLEDVIEQRLPNDREILLKAVREKT